MIWPEFRLHNAIFALRHVASAALALATGSHARPLALAAAVLPAAYAARAATDRVGDRDRRTTNAMPYPETCRAVDVRLTKALYASAQFGATAACLYGPATAAFAPLLGIEIAAFMMTAVRKRWVTSSAYHGVYASALLANYALAAALSVRALSAGRAWPLSFFLATNLAQRLRVGRGVPPALAWVAAVGATEAARAVAPPLARRAGADAWLAVGARALAAPLAVRLAWWIHANVRMLAWTLGWPTPRSTPALFASLHPIFSKSGRYAM